MGRCGTMWSNFSKNGARAMWGDVGQCGAILERMEPGQCGAMWQSISQNIRPFPDLESITKFPTPWEP